MITTLNRQAAGVRSEGGTSISLSDNPSHSFQRNADRTARSNVNRAPFQVNVMRTMEEHDDLDVKRNDMILPSSKEVGNHQDSSFLKA